MNESNAGVNRGLSFVWLLATFAIMVSVFRSMRGALNQVGKGAGSGDVFGFGILNNPTSELTYIL